jgi:uncharacterized protein YbjT (DUF2867 family)
MKVIIFGATGMVGQGALNACLRDPEVSQVLLVGRTSTGQTDPRIRELVTPDLFALGAHAVDLSGYDACFFCLGISSSGMDEASYSRITHDLTLSVAKTLSQLNPEMSFIYLSGAGADSAERSRTMWARVRGATENALRRLPFKAVYIFRPGIIQPLDGIRSKTPSYQFFYSAMGPLLTPLRRLMPKVILTTDVMGRAMIGAVRRGSPKAVLEAPDIYALSA